MEGTLKKTEEGRDARNPHREKEICEGNEEEACIEECPRDIKLFDKRMG